MHMPTKHADITNILLTANRTNHVNSIPNNLLESSPKFNLLKKKLTEASESGMIRGLDGRLLHIRSPHASLNTLIQGSGAVICKQWLVQMIDKIQKSGVDAKLVASVHDEYQFEVANVDTEKFGEITNTAIKEVQDIYDLKCPLDSEFKVGKNKSRKIFKN